MGVPWYLVVLARAMWRRPGWFAHQGDVLKGTNVLLAGTEAARKKERISAFPTAVKIDISPLCNLRCTVCLHAHPNGNPDLEKQRFGPKQWMTLEQYKCIIDQIRGRSTSVSLYYYGDPLVHPQVDEMCRLAADARLNVHVNTNFSFRLSDERIRRILRSGVTHFTVCLDGLTQKVYERTRVGGRIDWVLANLKRLCRFNRQSMQRYPKVEVQYLRFMHNVHEIEPARRLCRDIGVDRFTILSGALDNFADRDPGNYLVFGPTANRRLPQCLWPYFATLIKYDGDVLPCCNHRAGAQYADDGDRRALGNVFETDLATIWNSQDYRDIRRLVCSPPRIESEPHLHRLFCDECPHIFRTDLHERTMYAPKYSFEQVYTISKEGIPVRRSVIKGLPPKLAGRVRPPRPGAKG